MSLFCEICNYTASNTGNMSHHKKTQKHIKNRHLLSNLSETTADSINIVSFKYQNSIINDTTTAVVFTCENCFREFKYKNNYYRHKKTCNSNSIEKNKEFELQLKLEYSEKEKELYKKLEKEKSEMLNNFMNNANVLLNKANDNTKITAQAMQTVSVSAIKYANDKFNNAPVLMPLENFNINNLSFDNEKDREQLIRTLIYNAKQKSLDKLLGDHIVKCYKKENPEEQSFHTTDCSRLNYIVRDLIENALTWAVDKSGIKICSSIVKPLIEKCINLLLEYQKTLINKMAEGDYKDKDTVHTILNLLMTIDKGTLESDINKYIAPFFNLTKT